MVSTVGHERLKMLRPPDWRTPTRISTALFELKMAVFRARRSLAEAGRGPRRLTRAADADAFSEVVARSGTPLWSEVSAAERGSQLGKVHNLRRAATGLDGVLIPAGATFSFWKQVGKATRARGFATGRMLREGCMVRAVGGGLCQLSNALYDVALKAGCTIIERHGHSRIVPGSAAALGRDATVAWNYVDLRFAADRDLVLTVRLDRETLVVELRGRSTDREQAAGEGIADLLTLPRREADNCADCDETDCFLHEHGRRSHPLPVSRTAFIIDEAWPEFQSSIAALKRPEDVLALPLDGARWRLDRYRWDRRGFAAVIEAPVAALSRTMALRGAPTQGPARREAELASAARIASALAAKLGPEVTELCIAQSLLPHLWRDGWLGGRRFSVLMTRLPMAVLQARLDAAFAAHPDRASLADFRAPPWLAAAEAEALAEADSLITPHAEIADLFGDRAIRLEWARPKVSVRRSVGAVIAFPGPTVARKGAYELRAAAERLNLTIRPLGSELEGADFWRGVRLDRSAAAGNWLDGVAAVVQPALVEDAPRKLLAALAAGVPVIATPACGLPPQLGLTLVPAGDEDALVQALVAGGVIA
jgi:hypothetical protein